MNIEINNPEQKAIAQMAELQAVANFIAGGIDDDGFISAWDRDLFVQFFYTFLDISECKNNRELQMITAVIVVAGKHKGRAGFIHGSFETRRRLMEMGLTKTTVRFDDELEMLLLENLRELSAQEQILMGIK